ncbi:MAG TPA: hypothetical protein VF796_01075, partial [Humisphaera sp.]
MSQATTPPIVSDAAPADGESAAGTPTERREATRLSELTPEQRKSGIAAWLGWLFDGLDMHLYTLVAGPFVAILVGAASSADQVVKERSAFIQA